MARMISFLAAALALAGCGIFWAGSEAVVVDDRTGLEWQNPADHNYLGWDESNRYCQELDWAGQIDWRMPSFDELLTIHDTQMNEIRDGGTCCWKSGLYGECGRFMTSNRVSGSPPRVYFIDFNDCQVPSMTEENLSDGMSQMVRCVRAGLDLTDASTDDLVGGDDHRESMDLSSGE